MATLSIRGLSHAIAALQGEMEALARANPRQAATGLDAFPAVQHKIQQLKNQISHSLEADQAAAADLTAPSQRGFLWLGWLAQPEHLSLHLETLGTVLRLALDAQARLRAGSRKKTAWQTSPIQASLYNTSNLVHSRLVQGHIELIVHQGFAGAPEEVLQALVEIALGLKSTSGLARDRACLREYARGAGFHGIQQTLQAAPASRAIAAPQGQVHALEEIFERVNRDYFSGQIARPRLVWSRGRTRRKFGHYDFQTDTLMISRSLDAPGVPAYVVEAVMHHELLHKHLGMKLVNGRRYTHTAEFRAAERRFASYTQAENFLRALAKTLPAHVKSSL